MPGLFDGTPLERPVTCERCAQPMDRCTCPRDAAGRIALPASQPARVRREQRAGKVVTVVTGLDPVATDLAALLKQLRTTLGAGGAIKNATLELQGDHREAVVARLRELGYPAKVAGG
jgi:translation initiation factor 1